MVPLIPGKLHDTHYLDDISLQGWGATASIF